MIIKKDTEQGVKIYSTDPLPDSWKQTIRAAFGNSFDNKKYLKWAIIDNNPNYIGLDIYGSVDIPINGDLDCYYREHLYLDTATIEYEVYAYGEVPEGFPDMDALSIMSNSPPYLGSIKTDTSKVPVEFTVYYKKHMCDPTEYALLRERVAYPCTDGFGIGVKSDGQTTIYEEYENA